MQKKYFDFFKTYLHWSSFQESPSAGVLRNVWLLLVRGRHLIWGSHWVCGRLSWMQLAVTVGYVNEQPLRGFPIGRDHRIDDWLIGLILLWCLHRSSRGHCTASLTVGRLADWLVAARVGHWHQQSIHGYRPERREYNTAFKQMEQLICFTVDG